MTSITRAPESVDESMLAGRAASVARLLLDRISQTPDREAFRFPAGSGWQRVTWRQTGERASRQAAGLIALGVEPEQRVAVAAGTSFEWVLADLAIMCAGAATTTVYPTTTAEDVAYIVADSQSRVVFAEDGVQLAKLQANRGSLPDVLKVVLFEGSSEDDWVITLAELEELGAQRLAAEPDLIEARVGAIEPSHLATLIYTSGTTGRPKGVRLLHSAWTYEAASVDVTGILGAEDVQYLWLPLSHVFGKVLLTLPLQIGFATVVDGRVDKIVENLAVVRPTFMGAAPRIFEKAYARVVATAHEEGGAKAKIFDWAVGVGRQASRARQAGRKPSGLLAAQLAVADKLVFTKIRARFGGRLRFFISGSAALNRDIAEWFDGIGITIIEGYGLSETSAASFVNRPDSNRLGTVGPPLPGTEVTIAPDGEILIKGPGVMAGYHGLPDATTEALGADGWFHTGDIGELQDGYLRITDRKKDMFKTSNGKYVAPSAIDAMFKGICPYAAQLVVDGEGRSYCVALVALDAEAVTEWAAANGLAGSEFGDIATSPAARTMMQGYIDELNAKLNRWEQIKRFAILPTDLSVEAGEITPSMKLRRKIVVAKYRAELDALYDA